MKISSFFLFYNCITSSVLIKRQETTDPVVEPTPTVLYTIVNGTIVAVTDTVDPVVEPTTEVVVEEPVVTEDPTTVVVEEPVVTDDPTIEDPTTVVVEETPVEEPPVEEDPLFEPIVFDNFCLAAGFNEEEIANGTQQVTSTCSLTVQGAIPGFDNMVSTIITFPLNGAVIPFGENFTVSILTNNFEFGFFDDPQTEYYLNPQTLNAFGNIQGHSHITIQKIVNPFQPPDARTPTFFKGLQDPSVDGTASVEVDGTLFAEDGPGDYRICTMTSSRSHAPVLMPVARRGTQDDCIRVIII